MDYFSRKQVAGVAINRIRNARRGHQIIAGGREVKQGMNARPNQFFFTDEQHLKELVALGHARFPEDFEDAPTFPGAGKQEAPIIEVNEDQMPSFEVKHTGGGYYDIIEDGVTVDQVKSKAMAKKKMEALQKEWKEKNLPKAES